MDDKYGTDVFTDPTIKGRLGVNAMKAKKHLYDHIVYDSSNEQAFATELDTASFNRRIKDSLCKRTL